MFGHDFMRVYHYPPKEPGNLDLPNNLDQMGKVAHNIVKAFIDRLELFSDEKIFYSADEWKELGNAFGIGAELIVKHSSEDLQALFNIKEINDSDGDLHNIFSNELAKFGLFFVTYDDEFSAIYAGEK